MYWKYITIGTNTYLVELAYLLVGFDISRMTHISQRFFMYQFFKSLDDFGVIEFCHNNGPLFITWAVVLCVEMAIDSRAANVVESSCQLSHERLYQDTISKSTQKTYYLIIKYLWNIGSLECKLLLNIEKRSKYLSLSSVLIALL